MSRVHPKLAALGRGVLRPLRWLGALLVREPIAAWAGALLALDLLCRGHLASMSPAVPLNVDEGYLLAFGRRMLDGQLLPYVDAVSHRGPLLYWLSALVAGFGSGTFFPVRVAALAASLLAALLTFLAGRRAGFSLAGAVGALAFPIGALVALPTQDGVAWNGEVVMNVFAAGALLSLVQGLGRAGRPPSLPWIAVAGACGTLSALCKQVSLVLLAPLFLWVAAAALAQEGATARARLRVLAAFVGGAALPALVVLGRYAVAGQLAAFRYWYFDYNVDIYMQPYRALSRVEAFTSWFRASPLWLLATTAAVAWGLGQFVLACRRPRSPLAAYHQVGFQITVALSTVASVVGAKLAMRDFGHYFVQVIPWLGLLVGLLFDRGPDEDLNAPKPWHRLGYQSLVLAPLLLLTALACWPRAQEDRKRAQNARTPPLCEAVQALAGPQDRIFVWGFWPSLYTWCDRRPASRFVLATFPSGLVPWFQGNSKEQDDALAVPHAREDLIADLERSRAPVIIDAPAGLGGRPMRRYEVLGAYLDQHYHLARSVSGGDLLVRGKVGRRVLFDFEAEDLGPGWALTGDAFAEGTAPGARQGQDAILGRQGQRLCNTFTVKAGHAAAGTATSPPFVVDRGRLAFLAGGSTAGRVALQIEGKTVEERAAPRASQLAEIVWNVEAYRGKTAQIVLRDDGKGQGEHLLVDRIELFDVAAPTQR